MTTFHPIPKVSKAQAVKNKLYAKVKRQWWATLLLAVLLGGLEYPLCQVCRKRKAEKNPHHIIPKSVRKDLEAVEENFLAVCWQCHMKIHFEPAWAFANGYLGHSWDDLKELAERRKDYETNSLRELLGEPREPSLSSL